MYSAAELNISNDKKWLAQLGQWMGIGPKNEAAAAASQITASCIFRPLNHVPSSIDSFKTSVPQLPQIALFSFSFGGLLISSGRPQ